jgi:ferredoxin-NADP reductase
MVCGPPALVTGVTELLVQVGVAPDRVLTERY